MMNFETKLPTLADKAMLVQLTIRRPRMTHRHEQEGAIQNQLNDTSISVASRLFRGKHNPVREILKAANDVYTYHRDATLSYEERTARLLPNGKYFDYTAEMRHRMQVVQNLLAKHMPNYQQYVAQDMAQRGAGAKIEDYPSDAEFAAAMQFDLRFAPLPQKQHFLFDLAPEDMEAFTRSQEEALEKAIADRVNRVMNPLQKAISKLAVPIGDEGAIFRDSLITNLQEGIEQAKQLNLVHNEELDSTIAALGDVVNKYAGNPDALRESPVVRSQAEEQFRALAAKMEQYKGVFG